MYLKTLYNKGRQDKPKRDFLSEKIDRNFVASEVQLRKLMEHCPDCGSECSKVGAKGYGVDATFFVDCKTCQKAVKWSTQPDITETDLHKGNLNVTAATILAGNTFQDIKDIFEIGQIKSMNESTYYR